MGWSYGFRSTRKSVIEDILSPRHHVTIAHAIVNNVVYMVKEVPDRADIPPESRGKRVIAVYLIRGNGDKDYRWGYKDMDETMHPYYFDCPLRFFDLAPCPSPSAARWREKVREHHAHSAAQRSYVRSIRVGDTVPLVDGCNPASIRVTSTDPLVGEGPNGKRYRVQPRHVKLPITPPPPRAEQITLPAFDPMHCSGTFDGFSVGSDADPGL